MATGWFIWIRKNSIIIIVLIFVLGACIQPPKTKIRSDIPHIGELKTGNIVCRLGNGYFSKYFKEYASNEKKYSHIGILSVENDTVFVYHSEASELTGVGFVKREMLNDFLFEIKTYSFFNIKLNDTIIEKIVANSRQYYNFHTPFDLYFNSFNDDELYCSELLAFCINKATYSNLIRPSLELNHKMLYSLDDIYLNENIDEITFKTSLLKEDL
ncbi:YiiX/YebB-like N1pC/P60 family cysteine hydrolase [Ancylomarina sp. 16SWW S1-10-2]|uniref:YiiX/YebB-like N1pC/P60 family cysteine hydrolase n=1 Tax=Ancylomarina sp. 16SWW S1-10-2 TaxID=2499681 RepID=UPI0012ADB233|nr:YiiX/YebB-like N1pC/P60 family cysteine hydrolase [Ancylomarina sp. 16SWW S1-10-2]MRT92087.1 hypothetical protein [Ancylomarina sp. 16SWW S1-10-2]